MFRAIEEAVAFVAGYFYYRLQRRRVDRFALRLANILLRAMEQSSPPSVHEMALPPSPALASQPVPSSPSSSAFSHIPLYDHGDTDDEQEETRQREDAFRREADAALRQLIQDGEIDESLLEAALEVDRIQCAVESSADWMAHRQQEAPPMHRDLIIDINVHGQMAMAIIQAAEELHLTTRQLSDLLPSEVRLRVGAAQVSYSQKGSRVCIYREDGNFFHLRRRAINTHMRPPIRLYIDEEGVAEYRLDPTAAFQHRNRKPRPTQQTNQGGQTPPMHNQLSEVKRSQRQQKQRQRASRYTPQLPGPHRCGGMSGNGFQHPTFARGKPVESLRTCDLVLSDTRCNNNASLPPSPILPMQQQKKPKGSPTPSGQRRPVEFDDDDEPVAARKQSRDDDGGMPLFASQLQRLSL